MDRIHTNLLRKIWDKGASQQARSFKLSPLWHTALLPLLFLVSVIIMGYAVVTVEAILSSAGFRALAGDLNGNLFIIENLLFVIPVIILAKRANRNHPRLLFIAAMSMLLAGALFRINTYLIGYDPGRGWSYFPSVSEIMITVGLFAFEIMLYLIFVKKLPILDRS